MRSYLRYLLALSATCVVGVADGAQAGQFVATGSLAGPRAFHTATQLQDGRILIIGGGSPYGYVPANEVYDPASGSYSTAGSLAVPRQRHTATLLPDGRVLVVGGVTGTGVTASAEVCPPDAGPCTTAGSLKVARSYHTATLLPNGLVLFAGGRVADGTITSSVEVFDPASATSTEVNGLGLRRQTHTATLLSNGFVLIAGGVTGTTSTQWGWAATASAELFDPSTYTFDSLPNMNAVRANHTATLLASGKVLLAAGNQGDSLNGAVTASTEVFDPVTRTFSASANLANARYGHAATLLPTGKVLVTGGRGIYQWFVSAAELYDPVSGTVAPAGNMLVTRQFFPATLLAANGKVLLSAGYTSADHATATAELYGDPLLCR